MIATTTTESLWRNRDYVFFRSSRAISMIGSRVSSMATILLILGMHGGAVRAGAVGSCAVIAEVVFQLPGGYLADRVDPRRLMVGMDVLRLVAVASIPIAWASSRLSFPQLAAVVIIESSASVVFGSAAVVFIRAVTTSGRQYSRAVSQSAFVSATMSVVGPTLGGALYEVGRMVPFIVDSASYVAAVLLLIGISAKLQHAYRRTPNDDDANSGKRITVGMKWLWREKSILKIVFFCTVQNMVGAAAGLVTVIVMTRQGISSGTIGMVMACGGSAAFVGSLIAVRIEDLMKGWLYPISGLLWAGAIAVMVVSSSVWAYGSMIFMLSILGPSIRVNLFQLLRDQAPVAIYARVISAQQLMVTSASMIVPVLIGALVSVLGITFIWFGLASICLIASAFVFGGSFTLMKLRRNAPATT